VLPACERPRSAGGTSTRATVPAACARTRQSGQSADILKGLCVRIRHGSGDGTHEPLAFASRRPFDFIYLPESDVKIIA
jgi:hypothetical protein